MLIATTYEQVTQIKMSRFPEVRGGVAAYLVDGLLIDSGPAHTAQELADFLKDKSVKAVVNTHYHEDHICLMEKDKGWLFSGDLFHSTHPIVARPEENQWQIIGSLKKIKGLKPRLLFTSAGFVISEPDFKLEQAIQYLEDLGQKVKGLFGKGLSPVQIRQQLFGDENPASERTQGQFSSENLVKTFLKEA